MGHPEEKPLRYCVELWTQQLADFVEQVGYHPLPPPLPSWIRCPVQASAHTACPPSTPSMQAQHAPLSTCLPACMASPVLHLCLRPAQQPAPQVIQPTINAVSVLTLMLHVLLRRSSEQARCAWPATAWEVTWQLAWQQRAQTSCAACCCSMRECLSTTRVSEY